MPSRPAAGRALFYTRDSGGRHETTPTEYVLWAQRAATKYGVTFDGTPERIEAMIRSGRAQDGDLFLDYGVTGNQMSRAGLDALIRTALTDPDVTHVLIPRRDRFARPDDPLDALKLENLLRESGLTLVFMDRVVPPLERGRRRDVGELIVAMLDYNYAGEFRRELAQKMIFAQTALAKAGFSVGGRPPYGFSRWLAKDDGTPVRELVEGERVRMAGHHVVWLPGPEQELAVIRRILMMLETVPAARVAATLTAAGVHPPDAGRTRTDGGVTHTTSGVWHQTTIVNIARHPLLRAVVAYGRRSMGDQLRFSPEGPRPLEEADYRSDGKPKVVANPDQTRVKAEARFEPLVEPVRHQRLLQTLDERGGTQRGKPRSRDPKQNPLGGRVFDLACGWPMYREPYSGSFRYTCGMYMQSHGAECKHNCVDGPMATRFLLGCVRQQVLTPAFRSKLEAKLRAIAAKELGPSQSDRVIETKRAALNEARRKRERATQNLALAEDESQYRAVAAVFEQLRKEEQALETDLRQAEQDAGPKVDVEAEVGAALGTLDRMGELAADPMNLGAIGELFRSLNARLFFRFREVRPKKRTINRVSGGVVTFGATSPPVRLYEGPTGRRALNGTPVTAGQLPAGATLAMGPNPNDSEGGSLGNVSRGGGI
jgi:hypothetical protein